MARDHGEAPSPVQAACWLDVKGRFMELRPTCGASTRSSGTSRRSGRWSLRSDSRRCPESRRRSTACRTTRPCSTSGPSSIDGWLSALVAAELQIDEDSILDVVQHQLVLDGRRVDLTKLEFELFDYLNQRRARVVERRRLLRDVWGTDYAGGSNVDRGRRRVAPAKARRPSLVDRDGPRHGVPLRRLGLIGASHAAAPRPGPPPEAASRQGDLVMLGSRCRP